MVSKCSQCVHFKNYNTNAVGNSFKACIYGRICMKGNGYVTTIPHMDYFKMKIVTANSIGGYNED
jgi:hypothetical protein